MRLPLKKYDSISLIIIIVPLTISPLCLLLLVRLGVYTVNLCVFYFYKLIGKVTVFFQLHREFSWLNLPVTSSTGRACGFGGLSCSNPVLARQVIIGLIDQETL
jgi:hypothetical protein